jgi:CBS domain-containing protein
MKVRNVMTDNVETCREDDTLDAAAMKMWNRDCGAVPIVTSDGRVAGIVTDRDICMALVTQNRLANQIRTGEIMARSIYSINENDNVDDAIDLMRDYKIRRIPVVDVDQKLVGILSLSDIVTHADKHKGKKHISNKDALKAVKAVSEPRNSDNSASPQQDDTAPVVSETPDVAVTGLS